MATSLRAQTLTDLGPSAPIPGANDISQLSTSGNTTWPDGVNYFTDNNPPVGQTFTIGNNAMKVVSIAIKTAGLNSGNGYGTPSSTPTYYLRLYSMSGGTATLLNTFSAPNPGFTDGDWLQWSGLNVSLNANQTYAFTFGIQPMGGGWDALAVSTSGYAGGEIAIVPTGGGTIITGGSHSFDAVFDLGLQHADIPASTPLPTPTYGFNLGNSLDAVWGYSYPSQAVFTSAVNAGFNAVRIPCAWASNATTNGNNYPINPTYMARVKQTVDWAIGAGLYVVINDHWDGGWLENNIGTSVDPTINAKMNSYWSQIATTFAGYDNHLLFAAANEPNVGSPAAMNTLMAYYQTFVNAVRGAGGNNTNRWLVLQSVSDPSWLNALPTDTVSNRLMMEYHNYTPFDFTQTSSTDSTYFWGPAYHYAGDPAHNAVWGEEWVIDAGFQQLADQYVSKGIPVMVGEYQAAAKSFLAGTEAAWNRASAIYWNKYLVDSAHVHGLNPFYWSTPNSPFDYNTGAINGTDVVAVLTGGIAPPPPNGAPYAASNLTATNTGNGQISLSWTAGSGATSYNLYRAAESGYESPIAPVATGITGTSYTDTGLNSGTTYYYQVVAVNSSGASGFSPEAHATISGVNQDPVQFNFETDPQGWLAGGSPISGVATSIAQHYAGNQSLAVNFNGASGGTAPVYVNNLGGNLAMLPGSTITFRVWISSGSPVTTLQPFLSDFNWGWTSGWFQNLTAGAWNAITLTVPTTATTPLQQLGIYFTTSAAWTGTCYIDSISWNTSSSGNTSPAAPNGVGATAGNAQVALSWTASSGATSYNVKRATTSGGPYTTVANVGTTAYTDTGLANGTTYYYVVSALNAGGESANSSQVSATPQAPVPVAPTGLGAVSGNGVVYLNWTQSASPGVTGNNVYRSTTGSNGPYNLLANLAATTSYSDTAVTAGNTYFYSVSAVNSTGESAWSTYAGVITVPVAPAGLTATSGNARVALNWNASAGANSYNVKRATTSGGPYTTIASGVTSSSYTDTGLANGTTYYYVVSAVNPGGESANSGVVSATPTDLYGYWKFDEGSGTTATDSGSGGNAATLQSGASWVVGKYKGAVHFNGTSSSYATLPAGLVHTLADFSISCWVKVDTNATWARIFDFGSGTGTYMYLAPASGSGTLRYAITTSSAGGEQQLNDSAVLSAGSWHHVAVTLSGTTGILYVDGVAVATNSSMTLNPASLGSTTQNYLGKSQWNDPYLNGSVDDFRIYSRALNSSEISTLAGGILPRPWNTTDIGSVGVAGNATFTNPVFTVTGSGSDIWGTSDAFRYVYQTGGTNCSITARVTGMTSPNSWAKAGVMIRETLNANAAHATVAVTPGNGVAFQRRTSTGGSSSNTSAPGPTAPYWVRLTRNGSTFTAYYSANGTTWTTLGSDTISMGSSVYIGLPVASHNNSSTCTATFDNVLVMP